MHACSPVRGPVFQEEALACLIPREIECHPGGQTLVAVLRAPTLRAWCFHKWLSENRMSSFSKVLG